MSECTARTEHKSSRTARPSILALSSAGLYHCHHEEAPGKLVWWTEIADEEIADEGDALQYASNESPEHAEEDVDADLVYDPDDRMQRFAQQSFY